MVACKPPGEAGDDIRGRRNRVDSLQPARLVGQGENPPLLKVQFCQVVVGVEERRNLRLVVLGSCDLLEKSIWEKSRIGHVDPTKDVPGAEK